MNAYLGILVAFAIVLGNAALGFAYEKADISEFEEVEVSEEGEISGNELDEESVEALEALDDPEIEEVSEQEQFLQKLRDELNLTKTDYRQIMDSIGSTKRRLKELSEEKISLQVQLKNLDSLILLSTEKLIAVIKQVIEKENEIRMTEEQIRMKQITINSQKDSISDYIRVLYEEENAYLNVDENGEIDAFKLLLAEGSVSENLQKLKFFDLLNEAGQQMIEKLTQLTEELENYKRILQSKRARLRELQYDLKVEKENLELQKDSKEKLLAVTQGQENIFEELMEQSIAEQDLVLQDLKNLSNALSFIEQKVAEEGEDFDPTKYSDVLDERTQALYQFRLSSEGIDEFMWPTPPERGISAYFRDPTYVSAFGMRHNAVDIPAYQGSAVHAAASGVVYTVRDNGYGYSYLILAHADGFMTVYGHMSEMLVTEGDTVGIGTIIGLSGGMPGTKGAGYMTTGPHLHFEVLLNGMYSDPLFYLPLQFLTRAQLEEDLPEKYWDDWEEDVMNGSLERGNLRVRKSE